jgi:zinc metalloprotease ZmpB
VGDIVQIKDVEPPPIAPPTEPVGPEFNFDARTDNFAAVNAYYHADSFFRLMQEFGFDLNVYFGATSWR